MGATLDGQNLFDEQDLTIELGSVSRESIERTMSGLNGVLSIDLGGRGRKIEQRGVLRAKSQSQMDGKISTISAYMDGNTHTLVNGNGEEFDNLRMDTFKVKKEQTSGSGLCRDYEIVYTQLAV
jgi:hypothetical protein